VTSFSLGIGLTNACDLSCAHCYRGTGNDQLSVQDLIAAVEAVPTRSVNFGTGENGLHPDFARAIELLVGRGIAVTMTTNGHSAKVLPDEILAQLRDVEFSIDYPTREAHDAARGAGNWDLIAEQMERCARLRVGSAIVSVLMSSNKKALPALVRLAGERGALLRVNVFQSVQNAKFSLSYADFWDGWREALACADVVVCGEPILRAVLGIPAQPGAGCGVRTIRVTPRGAVVPCVYGGDAELSLPDLVRLGPAVVEEQSFRRLAQVPEPCRPCPELENCHGGCASRRLLQGGLELADEYCPFLRGERLELRATMADLGRDLPKAASACTTILKPRG
jgi:radical SAM protein with 4Fe4S-binding SPASM domain